MKRILSIVLLGIVATTGVYAQYRLSGQVLDARSRRVVEFANVTYTRAGDSIPMGGGVTDLDGEFSLTGIGNGTYEVRVSFLGYVDKTRRVTIQGADKSIGKIYLEEDSRALQEVEVVGQGSTMRFELDRKVFSVDQNIASAGGSVTDALENIPSVDVDQEGNISLRNSDGVEIWINGKPSGLTSENRAQILQQMPAESIQNIELITNPSAKFSPEGTSGIINLVLKKDRKAGYYGSVTAGIDYALSAPWTTPPGANIGLNINMNKGIVDAYFNAGYRYHTNNGGVLNNRYNVRGMGAQELSDIAPDSILTRLETTGQNTHQGGGLFLRGGVDIRITDHSTIGMSGFGIVETRDALRMWDNNRTTYLMTDYASGDTLRDYSRLQTGGGWHPGGNAMLDYRLDYGKHKLSVSGAYYNFSFNQDNLYTQAEAGRDTTAQQQVTYNTDRSVEVKADYEWKPTQASRLEAGYQGRIAWRKTEAQAWNGSKQEEELYAYYNDFRTDEQTHALYITYGNRFWDKLSVQAGLRGELFKRHLESLYKDGTGALQDAYAQKPEKQDTTYFQLYPSVYIGYDFGHGHELQLNYTRRVDRPRGNQLNPRQNFSDSTNISMGNPELTPSYSSNLELNYLKTWERHTLSAGLFWRYKEDIVQNVSYVDGAIMRNTYINAATRHETGLEIAAKNRLFGELLQLTTSVDLYYNLIGASTYDNILNGREVHIDLPSQQTFAWSARINASFLFTKTFSGQLYAGYRSPRVLAQGMTTHSYNIDLGLRKTFLEKRLALSLNVRDILDSRARRSITWGEGFRQESERRWHSRSVSLTVTYNFGNMQQRKPRMPQGDSSSISSYDEGGGEE
ncbi:MAG: TonB-dependent receptor [Paludibacteraceae bacterium]|nr:TonB-dependent receptor [Paludibacteraceae bacterium]